MAAAYLIVALLCLLMPAATVTAASDAVSPTWLADVLSNNKQKASTASGQEQEHACLRLVQGTACKCLVGDSLCSRQLLM